MSNRELVSSASSHSSEKMDENIRHAKRIRKMKNNKTDFTLMLDTLVDKVQIYKTLFMGKKPKFIHAKPKVKTIKSTE